MTFASIILTLQYCLETFEQCCACGRCDPCTRGQSEIKQAIETLEKVTHERNAIARVFPSVQFALERKDTRIEFPDRATLIQFVRELLPATVLFGENVSNSEIAGMAATRDWTLLQYQPGEYVRPAVLLQSGLKALRDLLLTSELNMDSLEDETMQAISRASNFEHLAALQGFYCPAKDDSVPNL